MLVLIASGEIGLLRRGDDPATRVSPVSLLLLTRAWFSGCFCRDCSEGRRPSPTASPQPVCAPPLEMLTLPQIYRLINYFFAGNKMKIICGN